MTGERETRPGAGRWMRFLHATREKRSGRVFFILGLYALGQWTWPFTRWLRELLVSGMDSWHRDVELSESVNLEGVRDLAGRAAFYFSYNWWTILGSVVVLTLCLFGVRFLTGVRGRASLVELGLRGRVPSAWKWICILALLPTVVWIGYVLLTTEPEFMRRPFTWKAYFFPYSAEGPGSLLWLMDPNHSCRPVWWLRSGVYVLTTTVLLYGFAWLQLRRSGIGFAVSALLLVGVNVLYLLVSYRGLYFGMTDAPGEVITAALIALATVAVHIPLCGWIVERWGGRVWPIAIAALAPQLPRLVVDVHYVRASITSGFDSPAVAILVYSLWISAALCLLALLTLLGPRLGLPSLREPAETENSGSA
jgi:hypothetical protein